MYNFQSNGLGAIISHSHGLISHCNLLANDRQIETYLCELYYANSNDKVSLFLYNEVGTS